MGSPTFKKSDAPQRHRDTEGFFSKPPLSKRWSVTKEDGLDSSPLCLCGSSLLRMSTVDKDAMSSSLPKITIVTTSYNQGQYLEQAIKSVVDQNYPNLEYFVVDGGSTDGTVALLEASGLEARDVHALREHYVLTVAGWLERFEANVDALTALVGEELVRVWRLYLVGGSMAFRDGRMGVDQVLLVRPGAAHGLPWRRSS